LPLKDGSVGGTRAGLGDLDDLSGKQPFIQDWLLAQKERYSIAGTNQKDNSLRILGKGHYKKNWKPKKNFPL